MSIPNDLDGAKSQSVGHPTYPIHVKFAALCSYKRVNIVNKRSKIWFLWAESLIWSRFLFCMDFGVNPT